jgi:heme exporter protein CcmD
MLRFLAMGGYARYVWPCYVLTAAVVGLNVHWARSALRVAQAEARRRLASLKAAS